VLLSSFILITVFTSLISAYSIGGRWLFIYITVSHAKAMNAVWQEDCNCGWADTAQSIDFLFLMCILSQPLPGGAVET
jgi:hypothetical protein